MAYFSPETVARAKEIDLFTYLEANDPDELVHFSRNTYTTRTHDSLKISNGMWYWFSRGIGGKSALEYLIQVKEYSFTEAMEILVGQTVYKPSVFTNYKEKQKVDRLILPTKSKDYSRAKLYLISRGISESIVQECIDNELIYQQSPNNNIVFVGYDEYKHPRYAFVRGTNTTRYMQDASGSDKGYSFKLEAIESTDTIHLFESAIDLLSYATLNENWYKETLISLAGVYQPAKEINESKVPVAVEKYLNNNPQVKKIILHFDNDIAGRLATISFQKVISNQYEIIDVPPKFGKDFNDYLCIIKGIKQLKSIERSDEKTL